MKTLIVIVAFWAPTVMAQRSIIKETPNVKRFPFEPDLFDGDRAGINDELLLRVRECFRFHHQITVRANFDAELRASTDAL